MIAIRRFRADEAPVLMRFIDTHWKRGHVLATHRGLLDWQHAEGDAYTYLGAWEGDEPLAILGYIPTRRYDSGLAANDNVIWLALWKLRDDVRSAGLGLRLLTALDKVEANTAVGVVGINTDHLPMYRALGYRVGELQQHVLFRPAVELHLARWPADHALPQPREGRASLHELGASELASVDENLAARERREQVPRKTGRYFERRYARHPFYRYRVHAVRLDGVAQGLLATRVAEHEGHRALRLVDWYGDAAAFAQIGSALGVLMAAENVEYADLWQEGMPNEALTAAGFAPVQSEPRAMVPTLFEPFVPENRRIHYAFRARGGQPCVLMRGDGDQDRPNRVIEGRA